VHIDVTLKPGVWIEPPRFFEKIADAGYAARKEDVRLTLSGSLSKEGDKLILTLADVGSAPVKLAVVEGKGKDAVETKQATDAFKSANDLAGQPVEIEGWWRAPKQKGGTAELAVTRVTPAKARPGAEQAP
jgi:hypothetical protein